VPAAGGHAGEMMPPPPSSLVHRMTQVLREPHRISGSVRRRLERLPVLRMPIARLADLSKTVSFWIGREERLCLKRQLATCRTVEGFYDFAVAAFGPHQIRSEILGLVERLRQENPRNVCEIGTADGGTNCLLTHALPTVTLVVGVDLFVKGKVRLRYFGSEQHELQYVDGSSYAPETVARVAGILDGRMLDVLFIDGDHSYNGVRDDFLCYRSLVREGGLIVFHDICPDFKTRFGVPTGRYAGDVPRFWQKLRRAYPHEEFVEDSGQDGLGIGMIRYSRVVALPADL
jgi:cephalosporin hydroxylase